MYQYQPMIAVCIHPGDCAPSTGIDAALTVLIWMLIALTVAVLLIPPVSWLIAEVRFRLLTVEPLTVSLLPIDQPEPPAIPAVRRPLPSRQIGLLAKPAFEPQERAAMPEPQQALEPSALEKRIAGIEAVLVVLMAKELARSGYLSEEVTELRALIEKGGRERSKELPRPDGSEALLERAAHLAEDLSI